MMKYYSLNNKSHRVSFQEATVQGLAPDRGLYFPESITPLPQSFFENIEQYSDTEIAYEAIKQFTGDEIPESELKDIINNTLNFDFPVIKIEDDVYALELYHGPTMAFKDVGARFMSGCLGYFNRNETKKITVLVATSGDTGGAVARGFLNTENTEVIILYPADKVSDIQELQLTTLGNNIKALKVEGSFDDCQDMVKKAFLDAELSHKNLTSANSINIARWLPQMFYYFITYKALKKHNKPLIISCPSGNFGNICAGILAKKLGLPVLRFVAATNINDTVPLFLETGTYIPKPSKPTLSNAMDVGNPSNFIRIRELYQDDMEAFRKDFSAYRFTDDQTTAAMQQIYTQSHYITDPHGAVGYLGLKKEMVHHPDCIGVFLETAHPVKFMETVVSILQINIIIPSQIQDLMTKDKISHSIYTYADLKDFILKN
jgi:threonine synthase